MIYPIPGGGLLGQRPVVPEEQLQRQIEDDTAKVPVGSVKLPAWMSGMGI